MMARIDGRRSLVVCMRSATKGDKCAHCRPVACEHRCQWTRARLVSCTLRSVTATVHPRVLSISVSLSLSLCVCVCLYRSVCVSVMVITIAHCSKRSTEY